MTALALSLVGVGRALSAVVSQQVIADQMHRISSDIVEKITRDNARVLFGID